MGWLTKSTGGPSSSKGDLILDEYVGDGGYDRPLLRSLGTAPDPEYPSSNFVNHTAHGYERNELVFACVAEKASSLPEAPLRVYPSGPARRDAVETHPLRMLLDNPNPLLSEYEMFEVLSMHLDLAGNAFWEIVRDRADRVVELWPLRPDFVRMRRNGRQVNYGYAIGGGVKVVPVEVVHFRTPSPIDPLVGTPPVRAALRAAMVDNLATDHVASLLRNAAVPGVVVKVSELQQALDRETTDRLKAKWRESYGGRRKGEPAFLQQGMDVQTLGFSMQDLEMLDLRAVSETRICSAFGVPPILVGAYTGLARSTFSNYAEARRSFWEETLMPAHRRIRDAIALQLLPLVSPPARGRQSVKLRFDYSEVLALRESEQQRYERASQALSGGGITINEFRHEIGLDKTPGGDVFLMPSGVIATRDVDGALEPIAGYGEPTPAADTVDGGEDSAKGIEVKALTDAEVADIDAHCEVLSSFVEGKRDELLSEVHGKAVADDRRLWADELAGSLFSVALAAASAAGLRVWPEYDEERTKAYQWRRCENAASLFLAGLLDAVKSALIDPEPRDAVAAVIDAYEGFRAERVGQTLATESRSWGAEEGGRQAQSAGRSSSKTWRVTHKSPRASCKQANGQSVAIGAKFRNGLKHPGDSSKGPDYSAGCTCRLDVDVKEKD